MPAAPPLIGTYTPPAVRRGDRVFCLYRDAECVVTSWADAPIPWPRVRALGNARGGGSGLWVNDELARAIRTESRDALMHFWGVSSSGAFNWRAWAGVNGYCTTPGSVAAQRAASKRGADITRGVPLPDDVCDRRVEVSKKLDLIRFPLAVRWAGQLWTPEMLARLGTAPDAELAAEWGKTAHAVRCRRTELRIPRFMPAGGAGKQ